LILFSAKASASPRCGVSSNTSTISTRLGRAGDGIRGWRESRPVFRAVTFQEQSGREIARPLSGEKVVTDRAQRTEDDKSNGKNGPRPEQKLAAAAFCGVATHCSELSLPGPFQGKDCRTCPKEKHPNRGRGTGVEVSGD